MGNKLCAPLWKKGYRGDDNPWTPKKDSHLLRLWAEIFEVQEQEGDICWAPVSTDVVPVNITCIQDTPEIVFQITAYNRHVEKIFDVKLIQPGTRLTQTSECFVHWKDSQFEHDWGLNFTTSVDARRFRECCMKAMPRMWHSASLASLRDSFHKCPTSHNYARKTSASGSLSISPPKRVRARKAISNPTTPVNNSPRRAISTPDDLGRQETNPAMQVPPGDSEMERRKQQRLTAPPDMRTPYGEQNTKHDKRASSISVYDNINMSTTTNHKGGDGTTCEQAVRHRPPPHPSSVHRPIAEREIPYNIYHQTTSKSHYHTYNPHTQNSIPSDQYDSSGSRESGQGDWRRDYAEIRWQGNSLQTNGSHGYYAGHTDQDGLNDIQLQFADADPACRSNSDCVSDNKKELSCQSAGDSTRTTTPKLTETFDSSTLKKMLQVLPDTPCIKEAGKQFNYASANSSQSSRPPSSRGEGTVRTRAGRPAKPERVSSNPGVTMRHCRDSYPGTHGSTACYHHTEAFKSATVDRAVRAATLPPGMGLGYRGSGLAGYPLDFGHPCVSDGAEPRHATSSDDSESESSSDTGTSDGSLRTMPSQSQMSLASKSAAVRKAGWLSVKNWLVHHKKKIEPASKRSWKNYWVCLKGTMLLFYTCEENEAVREDSVPRHMLVIEGAIAQSLPEHPKKEFIFSLSTAFGDAYLFQATSQVELENWICGIHSACASSFARQHGKENTLKLLHSEIEKLENSIDLDIKMKKMAEMQMSVVVDPRSKHAIDKQICQWDENLEKLYIEQYRLRCYTCSLQGTELPNPKPILSCVSKATKTVLSRAGVFTVSSFHACVCARAPVTTANLYSRTAKRSLLSTFKADSLTRLKPRSPKPCSTHTSRMFKTVDSSEHILGELNDLNRTSHAPLERVSSRDALVHVLLPGGHMVVVCVSDKMTTQEVLEYACNKRMLVPNDHFIRLRLDANSLKVPDKSVVLQSEDYEGVEIFQKIIFQVELLKTVRDHDFGLVAEAELADDAEQEDELCVFISEVTKGGLAHRKGLVVGDEILVINSKVIAELDMVYVEGLLQDSAAIYMTVRSCRSEKPGVTTVQMEHADVYIENMMCPPPPAQSRISDKLIDQLIVPAPNIVEPEKSDDEDVEKPPARDVAAMSSQQIDTLLQGAEQVTHLCRLLHGHTGKMTNNEVAPPCKPLSDSQRIRKVIRELIETERHYVKDLNCLIERYLEPLKEETFLSGDDIEQLFGNIREIVQFQRLFMQSLERAVVIEPDFNILDNPKQFKDADVRRVLFCLGGSFLHYANHFKLYSSFCASHSKAQKVLNPETNAPLQEFLRARNPKQQHSATLESFLIKPIQRILKYPLLLRQLCDLTDLQTDEHHHLSEALRGMEAVAEHINEMQKIYEEYGHVFDELTHQYRDSHAHTRSLDLNVGELQMYGSVNWLNALDELGKMKKGTELLTLVFVFRGGIVMLALERVKSKKKQKPPAGRPPTVLDCSDITRFQTVIPIDELQVRSATAPTDSHGLWELVHCRSRKEGRPENLFQFASSTDAKREFLKTIHYTIRESVRRMNIPNAKAQSSEKSSQPDTQPGCNIQGGGVVKRPDLLGMRRGKQLRAEVARHSMDVDEKVNTLLEETADFRTRSQTFTDLNSMANSDTEPCQSHTLQFDHNHRSQTVGGATDDRSSIAAKLLESSSNPVNYSNQNIHKDCSSGSPIWKRRNEGRLRSPVTDSVRTIDRHAAGAKNGCLSSGDRHRALPAGHTKTYVEFDDTDC